MCEHGLLDAKNCSELLCKFSEHSVVHLVGRMGRQLSIWSGFN
jgi:hypothetical protein